MLLGIRPRALCMLGKCFAIELHPLHGFLYLSVRVFLLDYWLHGRKGCKKLSVCKTVFTIVICVILSQMKLQWEGLNLCSCRIDRLKFLMRLLHYEYLIRPAGMLKGYCNRMRCLNLFLFHSGAERWDTVSMGSEIRGQNTGLVFM